MYLTDIFTNISQFGSDVSFVLLLLFLLLLLLLLLLLFLANRIKLFFVKKVWDQVDEDFFSQENRKKTFMFSLAFYSKNYTGQLTTSVTHKNRFAPTRACSPRIARMTRPHACVRVNSTLARDHKREAVKIPEDISKPAEN